MANCKLHSFLKNKLHSTTIYECVFILEWGSVLSTYCANKNLLSHCALHNAAWGLCGKMIFFFFFFFFPSCFIYLFCLPHQQQQQLFSKWKPALYLGFRDLCKGHVLLLCWWHCACFSCPQSLGWQADCKAVCLHVQLHMTVFLHRSIIRSNPPLLGSLRHFQLVARG